MNSLNKKNLPVYIFAIVLTIVTIFGAWYVYLIGGPAAIPRRSALNGFGRMLGNVSVLALAALYGRTVFKLILAKGDLWSRLEPLGVDVAQVRSFSGRILFWLNKTHPYLGVLAVASVFLHCAFTNSLRDNVFLYAILVLVLSEGVTGMIMEFQNVPAGVKRKNYLLHSQFIVGMVILFLTFLGHLLLKF
ncbi:MAG: hypothetical protein WCL23_05285 [Candidatus Moraniibacteriota bacterium]